jgi:Protein of unknown function (DUF1573)
MKPSHKILFSVVAILILLSSLSFFYFKRNIKTEVIFSDKIIDLGTIKIGQKKKAIFNIKNVGSNDLYIKEVTPDCHCTIPEWNKKSIPPNESTDITVVVNKDYEGIFQQVVSIECNSRESKHLLVVRGRFIN